MIRKIMWALLALAALGDCSCSTENPNEKNFPASAPASTEFDLDEPDQQSPHGPSATARAARAQARAGYPKPSN